MDSIDKIINQNRHLLDNTDPPRGHFDRFQAKLKGQTILIPTNHNSWIYAAATVAILISISFWGVSVFKSPLIQQQFTASYSEIHDVERYYQGQLDNKMQAFQKIYAGDKNIEGDVKVEIQEMETTRKSLIYNYQVNPGNERILNEIVNNYRLQIEMLNAVISMQTNSENDLKL
ncbi:hypothetical protein [Williamwhitmania taraxaci]|uniref:Uncharacterized protein n=1 Tax=Williamwhitmania taraxaci TaxID=1640674 RepID=A0A1G6GNF1_9BACT|nr:hypothetical protein [Williamwhitmania taraxaci]SDB83521.1 hypothetical protein SAMN05216323_100298 [Williamwhitmania taraxaci]